MLLQPRVKCSNYAKFLWGHTLKVILRNVVKSTIAIEALKLETEKYQKNDITSSQKRIILQQYTSNVMLKV